MSRKLSLSRRTLLRGAGALMALPVLERMVASGTARAAVPASLPRRLAVFYVPNGIHMQKWTPTGTDTTWELTPTLQSLAPVKSDVLLISGLANNSGKPDGDGHHAAGTAALLSCSKAFKTEGTDFHAGISMDQVIATHLAQRKVTRYASLEMGNDAGRGIGNCDSGYACPYANNISWAGPRTPMAKETNPKAVFDRLFAGVDPGTTQAQVEKRRAYGLSIIDFIQEDAAALQKQLGATDQRKLDEYFTGVRDLEKQVEALGAQGPACGLQTAPMEDEDPRAKTKAMMDLIVLAFQCDLTRVATFMLANARSTKVYGFLGLSGGHHAYSHHQFVQSNFDALARIDRWEVEQYAYLVQRLKALKEQDGTTSMLDNSMVFFTSEIEDGNAHIHRNLPVILAGKGGGVIATDRHLRAPGMPIANLYISMMRAMGVPNVTAFGADGTGELVGLGG